MKVARKSIWAWLCLILWIFAVPTAVSANPPEPEPRVPGGFRLILAENGTELYRKDYSKGNPDFVQVINLKQGARLAFMHGDITNDGDGKGVYGGNNPRFLSKSLSAYWQEAKQATATPFCVTNGLFFYMRDYPTRLAFPLKKDGTVLTDGYGINEYPEQKLMLEIWDDQVKISELSKESLYGSTAPNIIAGLTEEANKRAKQYTGRTFIGVDDQDGDGLNEILMIFNTVTAQQDDAASILRKFGADQVMMLDGGGSTQLICKGKSYIESERLIPQALAIFSGPPDESQPASTPELTVTPEVQTTEAPVEESIELVPATPETTVEPTQALTTTLSISGTSKGNPLNSLLKGSSGSMSVTGILWIPAAILPVAFVLVFVIGRIRRREYSLEIYDGHQFSSMDEDWPE